MKVIVFLVLLVLWVDPLKTTKVNEAKREAKEAFEKGNYAEAIRHYRFLTDSLGVDEDEVLLNLAHAYYQSNDSVYTRNAYERVTRSDDPRLKSTAYQQLGVMANALSRHEEALNLFKEALRANPANDEARYNYELVKKKLDEQKKQQDQDNKDNKDQKDQQKENQQDKQNQQKDSKDQQNQDQQKKEQQEKQKQQDQKEQEQKEQEQKEQQESDPQKQEEQKADPSLSEKLKEMQISEEKARMILEAMKNNEVQYLQQNKRKATKPKDKGKPDW